jgi:hypothetical protein
MLNYCFKICMDVISRDFRQVVLRILVKLYRELATPDWIRICEILIFLDDHKGVSDILGALLTGTEVYTHTLSLSCCTRAFSLCVCWMFWLKGAR